VKSIYNKNVEASAIRWQDTYCSATLWQKLSKGETLLKPSTNKYKE